ncbi:ComF family protein, partial [Fangia hongkongensis]
HNSNSTLFLNTISKYKYTKAQAQSDFTTRQNQPMNTFRQKSPLKANHLLIVDDVITTGATIKAIISMLQADGNNQINKISVLTLCRV